MEHNYEFAATQVDQPLSYKGYSFIVTKHGDDLYKAVVPYFLGGSELAGTRGKTVEECLIRTTALLNTMFIQPAVTKPRVGDLFEMGHNDDDIARDIIVNVDEGKLTLIPLKDATVHRHIAISEGKVYPYLQITNKDDTFENEIKFDFQSYIILEDGVLVTNNYDMDVFVWKAKADEK